MADRRESVILILHNCFVHGAHVARFEYRQHVIRVEQDILGFSWGFAWGFVEPSTGRLLINVITFVLPSIQT